MENPDLLQQYLNEAGLPGEELLASSYKREVKQALKDNIEKAISEGAFGVPSFICEEELFWGNDSLPDLEKFLADEDPLKQFMKWPDVREKWHTFLRHF
jgi:2-hydroxychromene-2-carboxylate isomerase